MTRKLTGLLVAVAAASGVGIYALRARASDLVLTGIVTTNDVFVSSQIGGQVARLLVSEGDQVTRDQLIAVIEPAELRADSAYYNSGVKEVAAQVQEGEAALRYQERQTADQIRQAEATLAVTEAQGVEVAADLENARLLFQRSEKLSTEGLVPIQEFDQARMAYEAAKAHADGVRKQVDGANAALALARANAEQITMRRSQLQANHQQLAAADAQRTKADVRLAYTQIHAPIDGIVDVRAVRPGEIVNPAQPILTLIDPDDLWVRADVEETYIDRIRHGDKLKVRLPSGVEREGTVFYRGVDAAFATQRDVSRTKRDIKTFEVRLRVDNRDRRLAVGMTAYVLLPVAG
jgi:HlyD family secretion protein